MAIHSSIHSFLVPRWPRGFPFRTALVPRAQHQTVTALYIWRSCLVATDLGDPDGPRVLMSFADQKVVSFLEDKID